MARRELQHAPCGAELFKIMTGVDLLRVPYRGGGPAIAMRSQDSTRSCSFPHRPGSNTCGMGPTARPGISSATRFEALRMCHLSASSCRATKQARGYGVAAPRNTSATIIDSLNKEINAGLEQPTLKARFRRTGC